MSQSTLSLTDLLTPIDVKTFWSDYWEEKPLHVSRSDSNYYKSIFSLDDLDTLLTYNNLRHIPSFCTSNNNPMVPHLDVQNQRESLNAYDQGETLLIGAVHQRWKPIAQFCRKIEAEFRHPTGATMVLSPAQTQGLPPHYDEPEVLALQLSGEKCWRIYPLMQPLPLNGYSFPAGTNLGTPIQEVHMHPGDLLYIPRGYPHEAVTSDNTSLHLSLYINVMRWYDLIIQTLMQVSEQHVEFRKALPVGMLGSNAIDNALIKETVQRQLQILLEDASMESAVAAMSRKFVGGLQAIPGGAFTQYEYLKHIGLETSVEKREGIICFVECTPDFAIINFPGNRVQVPAYLKAALEFIAKTDRFKVRQLPEVMTDNSKLVLTRRLIREGLLQLSNRDM